MPIYEYECNACGQVTETLQKFSDPPMETCPECGGHMHKLMSMNSFHLKGSGWYVTDYASKGAHKPEKASQKETTSTTATPAAETSAPKAESSAKKAD